MEKSDFQKEKEYFDRVEELIHNKLEKLYQNKTSLKEQVLRERKDMWEENRHLIRDLDDIILLNTQNTYVNYAENQYEWNEMEIQRLTKMEGSPYFGRLDFEEPQIGEKSTIYIGIYSLMKDETHEIYVVDWRAPVSSMFYNFDLGPGWYEVNDYKTETDITLKRQYKIEDGRFFSVYDTNSSMYDEILGEVLSQYSDHKLKVIIGSIQREQNLAIRSDTRRSCLIYGLAGSGKTSIGLHRLAYVLYNNKDTIKAENILILSNNNIFASYISTILPDLGEKPGENMVFADLLEKYVDKGLKIEDYYSQLKWIEKFPNDERCKGIMIKYSADMLQYCIQYFASFSFKVPEIRYKEETMVSPELFQNKLKGGNFPTFKSRYEMLEHLIKEGIEDFFRQHKDEICEDIVEGNDGILSDQDVNWHFKKTKLAYIQSAKDEVVRLNGLSPQKQMMAIYSNYQDQAWEGEDEAQRLSHSFQRGKLLYEDALFYLLIKVLMGEAAPFPNIYHTVIDESQDYSLLQLYIMKKLFPRSSFTLLGDIYQTINSVTTIQGYEDYEKIFGADLALIKLSKCYRSSSDINALAFALINETNHPIAEDYAYFERSVRKPQYVICRDMFSALVPILEKLREYHSVAVIVNNEEEALAVSSYLKKYWTEDEAQLIISPSDEIKGSHASQEDLLPEHRRVVIPLLLAKGLEFDAVILFNCIYSNVKDDHIRRKVYLGCTRALHELYFVERDVLPEILQDCAVYIEMGARCK